MTLDTSRPEGWFNRVCEALGLFDGARPVSVERVLWGEVLPAIEALKANNPEAGVLVREQQRVYGLWRDALAKIADAHRRADGFLNRYHECEAARLSLLAELQRIQSEKLKTTTPEPSIPVSTLRALSQQWKERANEDGQFGELHSAEAFDQCAADLDRLCDGETETPR